MGVTHPAVVCTVQLSVQCTSGVCRQGGKWGGIKQVVPLDSELPPPLQLGPVKLEVPQEK